MARVSMPLCTTGVVVVLSLLVLAGCQSIQNEPLEETLPTGSEFHEIAIPAEEMQPRSGAALPSARSTSTTTATWSVRMRARSSSATRR